MMLVDCCKTVDSVAYENPDIVHLAAAINSECAECNVHEMLITGSTVINRTKDPRFPSTIKGVINQKNQYQGIKNKQYACTPLTYSIAKLLLENNVSYDGVLYMWLKTTKKPKYVKKVLIQSEFHSFGI